MSAGPSASAQEVPAGTDRKEAPKPRTKLERDLRKAAQYVLGEPHEQARDGHATRCRIAFVIGYLSKHHPHAAESLRMVRDGQGGAS